MYVLDTNILVYHAAGEEAVATFFNEHQNDIFYMPSVVAAEFLSYPLITESAVHAFKSFVSQTISNCPHLPRNGFNSSFLKGGGRVFEAGGF